MDSISGLLIKSKKQVLFQQAYIIAMINEGLTEIQTVQYPNLSSEFKEIQRYITEASSGNYIIKFRILDNTFRTFIKTEICGIEIELRDYLKSKALDKIIFEIIVS